MLRRIRRAIRTFMNERRKRRWTDAARRIAASCGRDLRVNAPCRFTRFCSFGDNCNFNGMTVLGRGSVTFGSNFHSGEKDRKSTRLNSSHPTTSRMPSSA